MGKKMTKSEKVWAYLLKNKLATTAEVAKATGVSYGYTYRLMKKVGTPKEVFVAADKVKRTRVKLLSEASALVDGDREAEHGSFEDNAELIAAYWGAHLGIDTLYPRDVPIMLALMKLARAVQRPKGMDNYRDAAGYVALAGELNET